MRDFKSKKIQIMEIGKELAAAAKKKKLCKPFLADMAKATDIKPLCEMYFKGDDWAMENDFPSLETLRKFKGNSDQYGLHTDFVGGLENEQQTALFGDSDAKLNYTGFFAGVLNVRHNSKANIKASDYAIIVVNILDNAFVEIETSENAKVRVFQYGNNSNFKITGNVEIKEGKFEK